MIDFPLCRLNSRIGNPSMQAIQEENQPDDEQQQQTHRATPTKRRGKIYRMKNKKQTFLLLLLLFSLSSIQILVHVRTIRIVQLLELLNTDYHLLLKHLEVE